MKENPYIEQLQKDIIAQFSKASENKANQFLLMALRSQLKILHGYVSLDPSNSEEYKKKFETIISELEKMESDKEIWDSFNEKHYSKMFQYMQKLIDLFTLEIAAYKGILVLI